jgi:hypothetical protein
LVLLNYFNSDLLPTLLLRYKTGFSPNWNSLSFFERNLCCFSSNQHSRVCFFWYLVSVLDYIAW